MKKLPAAVAFAILIVLASGVGFVYAGGPDGNTQLPILGTTGAPALAAPSLYSGVITVLYASGTPVVLESNRVTFDLCNGSSCTSVNAMLKQTAPGTYTYSFTPSSLTGTITIYVRANALADDNGRVFPNVDTSVGTYANTPSTASSSSVPSGGTPMTFSTPSLTSQAVSNTPTPTSQTSPLEPLLITLGVLAVAGSLLVVSVVSKRH